MLLLACLLFSATEVSAQLQEALWKSGREMIYSATNKVVAETGTHAAADAVLTSSTQALAPIMQLAPVLAFDAYMASLPSVDVVPTANAAATATTPVIKSARTARAVVPAQPGMYQFATYAPAGFIGTTTLPLQTAPLQSTLQTGSTTSLLQRIKRHFAQQKMQKRQAQEALLETARQDLPKLVTDQTITVSAAGLLNKLPAVQPIDPPTMSLLLDTSKLAEAVEISNPNIPLLPYLQEPGFAYRGMAVTPSDIARFFQPGVGIERRLTEASNRLNMSMAAGSRGATVYFATHKVINMTAVPQHAELWGSKFLSAKKPILVIVRIKGNFGTGNHIINHDKDILPEEIDSMIALLEEDGNPRWFDIRATQDGMFQITPYEIMYKQ